MGSLQVLHKGTDCPIQSELSNNGSSVIRIHPKFIVTLTRLGQFCEDE